MLLHWVKIELLATVGGKCGCQPFSCRCSQNVMHCRKQMCSTCLFKTSIPAVPFWNSKHPVSTRSRFLRATVCSTSSALCLHHACKRSYPFVEDSGFVSHVEKHTFGHGVVVSKVCFGILERGAFCPCLPNVTHCWKEIFSIFLSEESMPLWNLSVHSLPEAWGPWERQHTLYQLRNLSHAEKQRVWSRGCGLQDLLRNIPISDGSMWALQNTEWFWRLSI